MFVTKNGKNELLLLSSSLLSLLLLSYILLKNLELYLSPSQKQLHVYNTGPFLSSLFNASSKRLAGLAVSGKVIKEMHSVGFK